jgi:glyoxylase-like metal-dependent hydrolase (beta-lactamase superfamily II)
MTRFTSRPRSLYEAPRRIGTLYQIAPDIAGLRVGIVNVFFLGEPGSADWVLVDAGLPGTTHRIIRAAEERFGPATPPGAIILTHGHFDHVGALRALLHHWNVPVFAHRLEMPYLNGRSSYPPPDPRVGGGMMALLSPLYPKAPIVLGSHLEPLPNDGTVPHAPEWRWFHTPGHTPGHISLFRERDRAMIVGDAFVTTRQESLSAVLQQRIEFNGPPKYFTPDWDAARESVRHLASMNPRIVATGHGIPLRGERMLSDLRALAEDFDGVARPRHGRYVRRPAVANVHGVVSIPPRPPLRPGTKIAFAGIGAAVLACVTVAAWPRKSRVA